MRERRGRVLFLPVAVPPTTSRLAHHPAPPGRPKRRRAPIHGYGPRRPTAHAARALTRAGSSAGLGDRVLSRARACPRGLVVHGWYMFATWSAMDVHVWRRGAGVLETACFTYSSLPLSSSFGSQQNTQPPCSASPPPSACSSPSRPSASAARGRGGTNARPTPLDALGSSKSWRRRRIVCRG